MESALAIILPHFQSIALAAKSGLLDRDIILSARYGSMKSIWDNYGAGGCPVLPISILSSDALGAPLFTRAIPELGLGGDGGGRSRKVFAGAPQASFTVRMLSEIFMEFQSKGDRSKAGSQIDQLVDWRIENVEDRKRRLALLEIDGFKKTMGFPLDVFVKEALAARYPKDGKPVEHTDRRDGRYRSSKMLATRSR